ncbi:MAG: sigma-70 family RNA polymerase sigma factor [Nanoarchaeota archaeon]|nr:sigma-70 family RNA polymerase sigma factor [Nanoarchaeota archaeon]
MGFPTSLTLEQRTLVNNNIILVTQCVKKFQGTNTTLHENELFSEAQEALGRAAERYDIKTNVPFKVYAFIIMTRQLIKYSRKAYREQAQLLEPEKPYSPADNVELADDIAKLQHCLRELPSRERWTLQLRYYKNYTTKEIATILQVSERRIEHYHMRALYRLRKQFNRKINGVFWGDNNNTPTISSEDL